MDQIMEGVTRTLNSVKGAWVVIVILAAFLSTIAGNVVSAKLIAQPSAHISGK